MFGGVSDSRSHGGLHLTQLPAPPPGHTGQSRPWTCPCPPCSRLLLTPAMFLVLIATEELREFFAKARAGSVRLIKVVIEDGECPLQAGATAGHEPCCFSGGGGTLASSPSGPQFPHLGTGGAL